MSSILESSYIEQNRPYSQHELYDLRNKLFSDLKLGKMYAKHNKCHHFYLVKENGKKEKELKNNIESNNCSVCWKLNKTEERLKSKAYDLVNVFSDKFYIFSNKPSDKIFYTYNMLDLETVYYKWLYFEN